MKRIFVYADFDFLATPQEIGILGYEHVRGNDNVFYRRVAFNVMFGNTDDHFRNHGFLLTPKGWTLSPAYDINPGAKTHQCLLIDY